MATTLPRPTDAPPLAAPWRSGMRSRLRRLRRRSALLRLLRDPFLVSTIALALIGLAVALTAGDPRDLDTIGILIPIAIGLQVLLAVMPVRVRPMTASGWSFLRLVVILLFVAGMAEFVGGHTHPLFSLYIPVVIGAAALGTRQAAVIGTIASLIYLSPELALPGSQDGVALRGLTLAGVSILVAVGTRRLVVAVERTTRQLRAAMLSERHRSRQIAGMEAVSRLLVTGAPTEEMLDRALGVLVDQFHYQYVSIYLMDGDLLRLGAQRGYERPHPSFDGTTGVIGRVMHSHELAFLPDVSSDLDYVAAYDGVVSEICAPLVDGGRFLGVLNVEAREPLDHTDRDLIATLAGRVATVVALGRDRQELAERAAVFRNLNDFTISAGGELELDRLAAAMVEAVGKVIAADSVSLAVLEPATGKYRLRGATEADPLFLGREVKPGTGLLGRTLREHIVVFGDSDDADRGLAAGRGRSESEPMFGAGIPILREGAILGAMAIHRRSGAEAFRPIEREAMELLASHAALAISNVFLHAEVESLATHDPLTGLHNRRYFDEALARVVAAWRRSLRGDRRSVAAVMFDLDRFGDFNKQHGHQVGDEVLRTFAAVLRRRFRDSDLVARFGGEEFVVILEGATRDDAVRIAEEVRSALAQRPVHGDDGSRLQVTVSAGCAELDEAEPTGEQLLRTADVALFMAKRAGRDRVVAA